MLGRPRPVPVAHDAHAEPSTVQIYVSESGLAWSIAFSPAGPLGISVSVWTTRAGVEAVRDACNMALVEHGDVS